MATRSGIIVVISFLLLISLITGCSKSQVVVKSEENLGTKAEEKQPTEQIIAEEKPESRFTPDKCRIMHDEKNPAYSIQCTDFRIKGGNIYLILQYAVGEPVSNLNLKVIDKNTGTSCNEDISMETPESSLQIECSNLLSGKKKFDGIIEVSYKTPSGLKEFDNGFIVARVE
jgi:hypothetical protein